MARCWWCVVLRVGCWAEAVILTLTLPSVVIEGVSGWWRRAPFGVVMVVVSVLLDRHVARHPNNWVHRWFHQVTWLGGSRTPSRALPGAP
jgi:hypothetical protein